MVLRQHLQVMLDARTLLPGLGKVPKGYNYVCLEDFILDRGRWYESEKIPDELMKEIERISRGRHFPKKMCFSNCQEFVLDACSDVFVYTEGYVQQAVIPVIHAWVEVAGKYVFDPTLRFGVDDHRVSDGSWPEGLREYVGVTFPEREEIRLRVDEMEEYNSILDDWANGYPLLKKERKNERPENSTGLRSLQGQGDQ
jgi:hypothetical protein